VIKPAVSASAWRTFRARAPGTAEDEARLAAILADGAALVQPFLPSVEAAGELSICLVGGAIVHAVRKLAAAGEFRVQAEFGGSVVLVEPCGAEAATARAALARLPEPPVLARVDLIDGPAGRRSSRSSSSSRSSTFT